MIEKKRWVFFALPLTFTSYEIGEEMLTVKEGFLNKKENSCYLYKVNDVELRSSLFERIFGLGTVVCYTGDVTHSTLLLEHIKKSKEIMTHLLKASEAERIKRRTIATQSLDGPGEEAGDS